MSLTDAQIERYSRQIILPEVGGRGQERLLAARVLLIGAGGLGSVAALYLAAAGIGTLGIVDDDDVELSNLHRQVLYAMSSLGIHKGEAARAALARRNPDCAVRAFDCRFEASRATELLAGYDVVVDASDNFPTRFAVNQACVEQATPLVSGSVLRFDGQVSTFLGFRADAPCYRCWYREPPPVGLFPADDECGAFGVVAGVIGAVQAIEAVKLALGVGAPLVGRAVVYDALRPGFREIALRKAPDCPTCAPARVQRRAG